MYNFLSTCSGTHFVAPPALSGAGEHRVFVRVGGNSVIAACAPIPLKAALHNHAGSAASEIEPDAKIYLENGVYVPVSPAEKLVHLWLGARSNVDAFDLAIVLQGR
jgi:hypothetical protein